MTNSTSTCNNIAQYLTLKHLTLKHLSEKHLSLKHHTLKLLYHTLKKIKGAKKYFKNVNIITYYKYYYIL